MSFLADLKTDAVRLQVWITNLESTHQILHGILLLGGGFTLLAVTWWGDWLRYAIQTIGTLLSASAILLAVYILFKNRLQEWLSKL